jgi:molybdate transport system substrate-binding protein
MMAALLSMSVSAAEIKVLASGAFRAAYNALLPGFEKSSGHTVVTTSGGSVAGPPTSIPNRLRRGESYDMVILAGEPLDELAREGLLVQPSRTDLARSTIGVAVRAGAVRPDISTPDAVKRLLLAAKSVAFSSSASGVSLIGLFERMGIAAEMKAKSLQVSSGPVAAAVARGEAEIGFQQISEILPVKGIDYIGPLPDAIQEVTVFAGALTHNAGQPDAARALLRYLSAPESAEIVRQSGMLPMGR